MNDFIEKLDIEKISLEAHVDLCAERYQQITDKFDNVEKRLDRIDDCLVEIKEALTDTNKDNLKMYLTWAGVIITTLLGACGVLISHYVLK